MYIRREPEAESQIVSWRYISSENLTFSAGKDELSNGWPEGTRRGRRTRNAHLAIGDLPKYVLKEGLPASERCPDG